MKLGLRFKTKNSKYISWLFSICQPLKSQDPTIPTTQPAGSCHETLLNAYKAPRSLWVEIRINPGDILFTTFSMHKIGEVAV